MFPLTTRSRLAPDPRSLVSTPESRYLTSRIAIAAVGLPLLVLIVWAGASWFTALVGLAAAVAALELTSMARLWDDRPMVPVAVASAVALVVAAHFAASAEGEWTRASPILAIGGGASLVWLLWRPLRATGLGAWGATAGVALYTGGLLFHAPLLRALDQGRDLVLLLLIVTFATDTCAFLVGKAIGRRPMAPAISPSKTWEGTIGGIAGALGASVGVVYLLDLDAGIGEALAVGALLGVVGQLGDLAVSRMKRNAGVKDTGRLLPGHGGLLDRLDSIVFNVVVLYYFVL